MNESARHEVQGDADTDPVPVGCDALSTGKWLQTFRKSALPPSLGYRRSREEEQRESFWGLVVPEDGGSRLHRKSVTVYRLTQRNSPE